MCSLDTSVFFSTSLNYHSPTNNDSCDLAFSYNLWAKQVFITCNDVNEMVLSSFAICSYLDTSSHKFTNYFSHWSDRKMKYKYAVSRKPLHFYHIDKSYIHSNQIVQLFLCLWQSKSYSQLKWAFSKICSKKMSLKWLIIEPKRRSKDFSNIIPCSFCK